MTQEEKQLLLKDLCARLSYGVQAQVDGHINPLQILGISKLHKSTWAWKKGTYVVSFWNDTKAIENIKPYLRPMSSMTEDEMVDYGRLKLSSDKIYVFSNYRKTGKGFVNIHTVDRETGKETYTFQVNKRTMLYNGYVGIDWLNKKMFDYRGLIPMGLALPALEDMYNV